jgi:predicted RNA binding protein YcfA (HicA-like mRNA interferase family)
VPVHAGDVIGPKLLKSILDQAVLSADDFRRLR